MKNMGSPPPGWLPAHVLSAHLAHMRQRGLAPRTVAERRAALARTAARIGKPLLEATPADLAAWRAGLVLSDNTVLVYGIHVRQFYDWALAEHLITLNPAAGLLLPRQTRGLPRPIGEEVLMDAVETAPLRVRPWLVLAAWAGFRACEIAGLRRERVLDSATPPMLLVAADATKGHRERLVPMSAFTLTELRLAGLPRSGWVFRRRDGLPGPNTATMVSHLANQHLRSCGTSATLHQLRHRFLTMAYRASHDLRLVQELAGHRSPTSTAGYAAFDSESAVVTVEAIPVPDRLRSVPLDEASGG